VNFADKIVVGLAGVPIMTEMKLDAEQFGQLGSSFFLLFSISAIVVGFVVNMVHFKLETGVPALAPVNLLFLLTLLAMRGKPDPVGDTPPLLKQWEDLVLEHGWAYGRSGTALRGKHAMHIITAGGREEAYQHEGYNRFTMRELLAPHVDSVIAVDGSADMVQAARRRLKGANHVEVRRGDMEALPIDAGQLDVAVLALVLHHVPEPVRALTEVHRVLKPGGRALIVDMLPHDREEYQHQMGHVWLGFAEKTITKHLEAAGFGRPVVKLLPTEPNVKGPSLFVATARRE